MRRTSLPTKFALASAIPITLLGLVLAQSLRATVQDRAIADAEEVAELVSRIGIQPLLSREALQDDLAPTLARRLDRALNQEITSQKLSRVNIWNRNESVVYSDGADVTNDHRSYNEDVREALEGQIVSEVTHEDIGAGVPANASAGFLEVYVPIRFRNDESPSGAFELYLPYAPVAQAIEMDTRRLYLILLAGLVLLFVTLFRIVARASRKLGRQTKDLKRQVEANGYQALHDSLTDLPNRSLFRDRVAQTIVAGLRDKTSFAVLLMDLDRFKEINDTLGHPQGDLLLQQVGPRLTQALRDSDTVARLGGDEFAVLLRNITDASSVMKVATELRRALEAPIDLEVLTATASIGIALYPRDADTADGLMRRADVAMYNAKKNRSGCELYDIEQDEYRPEHLELAADLRRAISERALDVFFQPKAEIHARKITGAEALVRWRHPERGLMLPDDFVPLAEHTGLIKGLTLLVVDRALEQSKIWRDDGMELTMAVNLSPRDLTDLDLPTTIAGLLVKWGIPARYLELEITESTIMTNPLRAIEVLKGLSAMGISLAIDDFGTGHSSLAYLKRLPVSALKIDKSFIMGMAADSNDAAIVRATIELGHDLGLRTIAEGVTNQQAWNKLDLLGCDLAQGWWISPPLPPEELSVWLSERPSSSDSHLVSLGRTAEATG